MANTTKDFSRQLKSLYSKSNELANKDGLFAQDNFYHQLEEFIKFYDETVAMMKDNLNEESPLITEKIESLPQVEFKNYGYELNLETALYTIGYAIFFPIGIYYMIKKYNYVSSTKEKLRDLATSLSTLEFLTREK